MPVSNTDIINTINNDLSLGLPVVTPDNYNSVTNQLLTDVEMLNTFNRALFNVFGLMKINGLTWENKLAFLKKERLDYGGQVADYFVETVNGIPKNEVGNEIILQNFISKMKHQIYNERREQVYPTTILLTEMRRAFQSQNGLDNLVNRKVQALYTSNNIDEYKLMKEILLTQISQGQTYVEKIASAKTDPKGIVKAIRTYVGKWLFPSLEYNVGSVQNVAETEDVVIFMTPETQAEIDVEVLAQAFNLKYSDFLGRIIIIDNFGDELPDVQLVMTTRKKLQVFDEVFELTSFFNSGTLTWNYFLNVAQIYGSSPFENCIALTSADIKTISGITIPATAKKINDVEFEINPTLTTTGTGIENKGYYYNLIESKDSRTQFVGDIVFIGSKDSANRIKFEIVATQNNTKITVTLDTKSGAMTKE